MLGIYISLQKSFQTIMAVAYDCVGLILAAVILHDPDLLFLGMVYKFPLGLFYVVFRRKF